MHPSIPKPSSIFEDIRRRGEQELAEEVAQEEALAARLREEKARKELEASKANKDAAEEKLKSIRSEADSARERIEQLQAELKRQEESLAATLKLAAVAEAEFQSAVEENDEKARFVEIAALKAADAIREAEKAAAVLAEIAAQEVARQKAEEEVAARVAAEKAKALQSIIEKTKKDEARKLAAQEVAYKQRIKAEKDAKAKADQEKRVAAAAAQRAIDLARQAELDAAKVKASKKIKKKKGVKGGGASAVAMAEEDFDDIAMREAIEANYKAALEKIGINESTTEVRYKKGGVEINHEWINAFTRVIAHNKTLRKIEFLDFYQAREEEEEEEGINVFTAIIKAAESSKTLQELHFINVALDSISLEAIAKMLTINHSLKSFEMVRCFYPPSERSPKENKVREGSVSQFAQALKVNNSLTALDVCDSFFDDESSVIIKNVLDNKTLITVKEFIECEPYDKDLLAITLRNRNIAIAAKFSTFFEECRVSSKAPSLPECLSESEFNFLYDSAHQNRPLMVLNHFLKNYCLLDGGITVNLGPKDIKRLGSSFDGAKLFACAVKAFEDVKTDSVLKELLEANLPFVFLLKEFIKTKQEVQKLYDDVAHEEEGYNYLGYGCSDPYDETNKEYDLRPRHASAMEVASGDTGATAGAGGPAVAPSPPRPSVSATAVPNASVSAAEAIAALAGLRLGPRGPGIS